MSATVLTAKGESSVTLAVYSASKPAVDAAGGTAAVQYDAKTNIARVEVKPDATAGTVVDGDSVVSTKITLRVAK